MEEKGEVHRCDGAHLVAGVVLWEGEYRCLGPSHYLGECRRSLSRKNVL